MEKFDINKEKAKLKGLNIIEKSCYSQTPTKNESFIR